jgi:hypothetical protein
VTAACGIKSVGDLEGSGTDGSSDSGDDVGTDSSASMSATSLTGAESVGEVDTGNPTEPTSSDVDTGNPTEPTDTGCVPDDATCDIERTVEVDAAQWSLTGFAPNDGITALQCTITELGGDGPTVRITLGCGDEEVSEHVLEVVADPHAAIDVEVGLAVTLTYATEPIFWINRWFALRDQGGRLRLGGGDGSNVLPPGGEALFEPLGLTIDAEACPMFEPCDPSCGTARRQAIEFHFGDDEVLSVPDGTIGGLAIGDAFTLVVARAEELLESDTCKDVPPNWYSYVIYGEAGG